MGGPAPLMLAGISLLCSAVLSYLVWQFPLLLPAGCSLPQPQWPFKYLNQSSHSLYLNPAIAAQHIYNEIQRPGHPLPGPAALDLGHISDLISTQPVCSSHAGLCCLADILASSWPRASVLGLSCAGMLFPPGWLAPSFRAGFCALLPYQRGLFWVLCLRCTICLSVSFTSLYFSLWYLLFRKILYLFGYCSLFVSLTRL